MSYNATVYNVMIASPSDVSEERKIIRRVVHEWNTIHSKRESRVLLPVGWDTDSYPEQGDRPQALINKQILEDADLLVAVFWTRLGTPTGVAASGTPVEPQCWKNLDMQPCTMDFIEKLVVGRAISSAGDFGDYIEFGLDKCLNLGLHETGFHLISTEGVADENRL